jgi:hypothetical protein
VTLKLEIKHVWPVIVLGFVSIPLALSAQTTSPGADTDWRSANNAVGLLKRGHADVLKWEQANASSSTMQVPVADGLKLLTIEDVTRQAWRNHRDLAQPLARLGAANVALIAEGRWTEVDPGLWRKVDDMDEVLHVAVKARKAWLQALATRQTLAHYQAILDATDAASELGQRMVNVGNWSALQHARVQGLQSSAQMNLARAQYAATQSQTSLINTLGLTGKVASVTLPESLPELPPQLMPMDAWQQKALAIRAQLPEAESLRSQAHSNMALAAYQASHALVKGSRDALKTQAFINEETLLHYNGMLSSVWDVLDASRNQSQAAIDAIGAQRDFWIAEVDLQWVFKAVNQIVLYHWAAVVKRAAPAAH